MEPSEQTQSGVPRFLRAVATVSGWTMMSRILGFVRDLMIAAILGTGPIADAFFIAFRLPNMFRRWFAEGALNSALVPLYGAIREGKSEADARQFASQVTALMLVIVIAATLLAIWQMPWIIRLIAPGFTDNPEQFDLTVLFGRIMFPYLGFMMLMALYGGLLNARGRFAAAAAAPVALNVIVIAALAFVVPRLGLPGHVMSWAVIIAGLSQFIIVFIALEKLGVAPRPALPRLTPDTKKLFKLMGPGILSGGVAQINIIVAGIFASTQAGAVSYLYYADRIFQLPWGVIGVAIGVVLLPALTAAVVGDDKAQARSTMNRSIELAMALILPATIAMMVIALPIISVLFERGAFDATASQQTALALMALAPGLPAFVLTRLFNQGYYAEQDTLRPFYYATVNVAVNVAFCFILFPQIGFVGLAVAQTIAIWVNTVMLGIGLIRRDLFLPDGRLIRRLIAAFASAAIMGGGLYLLHGQIEPWFKEGLLIGISTLILLVVAGLALYAIATFLTGAITKDDLNRLRRKQTA